jgi:hypothetical protein
MTKFIEWTGSILALTGSFLLALNMSFSACGWLFFLASSVFLIAHAIRTRTVGFLTMQTGFFLNNILGIVRHFF